MADAAKEFTLKREHLLLGGLFASVTLALAAAYFLFLKPDYVILHQDLKPEEASALIGELDRQSIRYRLGEGGTSLLVPGDQADRIRVALAGAPISVGGQDGFELFDESDMGLTDFAQKIKYQRALQGEISKTLHLIEGIEEARVHIAMPDRTLFKGEESRAKAAITLIWSDPALETEARIEGVRWLVASAVPDLSINDVIVLNGSGEIHALPRAPALAAEAAAAPKRTPSRREAELIAVAAPLAPNAVIDVRLKERAAPQAGPVPGVEPDAVAGAAPEAASGDRVNLPSIAAPSAEAKAALTGPKTLASVTLVTGRELASDEKSRLEQALRSWRDKEVDIETVAYDVAPPPVPAQTAAAQTAIAVKAAPPLPAQNAKLAVGGAAALDARAARANEGTDFGTVLKAGLAALLLGGLIVTGSLLIRRSLRGRAALAPGDQARFADRLSEELLKGDGGSARHAA